MRPSFYLNAIDDVLNGNASDNSDEDMRQSFAPPVEEEQNTDVKELPEVKSLYQQLKGLKIDVEEEESREIERLNSTKMSLAKIKSLISEAETTSMDDFVPTAFTPKCEARKFTFSDFNT